jgi:hypothetical protein
MILKGFCKIQNKEYTIDVDLINANALEDLERKNFEIGRINCYFTRFNDICDGNCSIVEQYENKRN